MRLAFSLPSPTFITIHTTSGAEREWLLASKCTQWLTALPSAGLVHFKLNKYSMTRYKGCYEMMRANTSFRGGYGRKHLVTSNVTKENVQSYLNGRSLPRCTLMQRECTTCVSYSFARRSHFLSCRLGLSIIVPSTRRLRNGLKCEKLVFFVSITLGTHETRNERIERLSII